MKAGMRRFVVEDSGQDLIEYALLVSCVSLACMVGVEALTNAITSVFSTIAGQLE
jgi:Flp pilus assembly pilin Flp